jgi:hypothetical protein
MQNRIPLSPLAGGVPVRDAAAGLFPTGRAKMEAGLRNSQQDEIVLQDNRGYDGAAAFRTCWGVGDDRAELELSIMTDFSVDSLRPVRI